MKRLVLLALFSSAVVGGARRRAEAPPLRLARIFGDGMVVQRDAPLTVWGWAAPRAPVTVAFRGHAASTVTAANGAWRARLAAGAAGGPFELTVRAGMQRIDVRDVLVGDVWLAGGQSNMELTVSQADSAAAEIAAARDSSIRQFKVPDSWSDDPSDSLAGGSWSPADPAHVGDFSAVAYYFARDLRRDVHVPIGIINDNWGGSNIETWIGRPAQHLSDSAWSAIQRGEAARIDTERAALRARIGGLPEVDSGFMNEKALWAAPDYDDSAWRTLRVPGYWEDQGYTGLDGVAWYRVAFDLDSAEMHRGVRLSMAAIDDDDITWLNGVEVGRTSGYNLARSYALPPGALRRRNVLAVRVADGGGNGGINGPAILEFGDGSSRSLAGAWKFKVAKVSFLPDGQRINKIPSILYNKMVHPLLPITMKGVLWYQGESNANNDAQAAAYRDQFTTLIQSWRAAFNNRAMPFLWVQLPGFNRPDSTPPLHAAWAIQRESMEAALSLPNTGRAIAIDVGDSTNIHPRDKQTVGYRLALVARRVAYHQPVLASGPTYRALTARGDTLVIAFENVGSGLVTHPSDASPGAFAIAGADRKFVWANARIAGNTVRVWSDRVRAPAAVRYAWSNFPLHANLYNREGLPAAPFRTDRW